MTALERLATYACVAAVIALGVFLVAAWWVPA